ncbi:phosphoribosyltransferase [Laceyella putida]|uniref:Phosphoribosyltransferase n=1 Tax=Laceyella putida TaxID=110101 RepID=A0ABW2RF96_9BACL
MNIRNIYLDYNAISLRLDTLAKDIMSANFDGLVIILRGGSFAGMHLAFLTGLPYYFLRYDRKIEKPAWLGNIPEKKRLLICEDFAGMGKTLINCKKFLVDLGYDVSTLVICKDRKSASTPDYYCFDCQETNARFLLPWERYRINPSTGTASENQELLDHEYERTAWDMDGVFIDGIKSAQIHNGSEGTPFLRDQDPIAKYAPVPLTQDIIISSRPVSHKESTEKWFRTHNIYVPIIFRDDDVELSTLESVAKWKGSRAIELGFTHFVSGNSEVALFIAAFYPELRVIWWNQGHPISLQASK